MTQFVPPRADDVDLRQAAAELQAGREALRMAHEIADKNERRAAIKAAIDRLALSTRFIDSVVERRGGTPGDVDADPAAAK